MATNEFLPIANAALATVTAQGTWAGSSKQLNGFPTGQVARADFNKALRQSSVVSAAFAQVIADVLAQDVLDNGDLAALIVQIKTLLERSGGKDIPRRTSGFAAGECTAVSAGVTINTSDLAEGRVFSIYNDSGSNVTITQGAGVTLRMAGTILTGNMTLAGRGMATVWCNSATEAIVMGPGVN